MIVPYVLKFLNLVRYVFNTFNFFLLYLYYLALFSLCLRILSLNILQFFKLNLFTCHNPQTSSFSSIQTQSTQVRLCIRLCHLQNFMSNICSDVAIIKPQDIRNKYKVYTREYTLYLRRMIIQKIYGVYSPTYGFYTKMIEE